MPWVFRGLREGVVTTRYPRRPDGYGPDYRAAVEPISSPAHPAAAGAAPDSTAPVLTTLCPTGAIHAVDAAVRVDQGRCILCGRCVQQRPEQFRFEPSPEVATLTRSALVVPFGDEDDAAVAQVRAALDRRVRALRRSVHIRHVDAGSDGSEEWEVAALTNPVYDVQRLGIFFTATPRHADILLVTGSGTTGMTDVLQRTYQAMPYPKIVIAAGTDAISGGLIHPSYATQGGIGDQLPVDVWVPGSPPSPFSLLHAILLAVGLLAPSGANP